MISLIQYHVFRSYNNPERDIRPDNILSAADDARAFATTQLYNDLPPSPRVQRVESQNLGSTWLVALRVYRWRIYPGGYAQGGATRSMSSRADVSSDNTYSNDDKGEGIRTAPNTRLGTK